MQQVKDKNINKDDFLIYPVSHISEALNITQKLT